MKKLGEYINGNCKVTIFDDGTKIRFTKDNEFYPEKPESMDLKITNRCTGTNCAFCHEKSGPEGDHGDIMNLKFIDTLLPYTEIALGGGNIIEHPDLIPFLYKCMKRNLICNATFNQFHFRRFLGFVKALINCEYIHGVGVSLTASKEKAKELSEELSDPIFKNAVVHVINGIHSLEVLEPLMDKGIKILILGYKTFGRGVAYGELMDPIIKKNQQELKDKLPSLIPHFKAVSFDNLAINQLGVKDILPPEEWNSFYMGEEGQFTMYIDAVKGEYATCSIAEERFPIKDDIKDMFSDVRIKNGNITYDEYKNILTTTDSEE